MFLDAQQVLIKALVGLSRFTASSGMEWIIVLTTEPRRLFRQAGIVVIGQHQAQPCDMHDIGGTQPSPITHTRQAIQQTPSKPCRTLAPQHGGNRQTMIEGPVRLN